MLSINDSKKMSPVDHEIGHHDIEPQIDIAAGTREEGHESDKEVNACWDCRFSRRVDVAVDLRSSRMSRRLGTVIFYKIEFE